MLFFVYIGHYDNYAFFPPSQTGVPRHLRKSIAKLAECGWMYNKIWKYADSRSTDRAFGLVGQVGMITDTVEEYSTDWTSFGSCSILFIDYQNVYKLPRK